MITENIISECLGKEILFPTDFKCNSAGKDTCFTLCSELFKTKYKVLLYVDSFGCTNCRLHLYEWKNLIDKSDSTFGKDKLGFLFFYHPKKKNEMPYFLRRDRFDYPVFIDTQNSINQLNHFPSQPELQCFLLDKDNKVLLIGNPVLNPKIWELYKQTITGTKDSTAQPLTSISVEPEELEIMDLSVGKKSHAAFKIKNTGSEPFIIHSVDASCGCTVPAWEKQPVASGGETEIRLEIQPEETGVFRKTVRVYGNVEAGVITVTIKGTVK
jgi:hypothetical protein